MRCLRPGCWLVFLLGVLLLSAEVAEGKNKTKKPKTVQEQMAKRLLKLTGGDEAKLGALTQVTDAMMPAQGESW